MEIFSSIHDVLEISLGLSLGKTFSPLQFAKKITILAEFRHNIHIVCGLINVVELNNVLMENFFHDIDF